MILYFSGTGNSQWAAEQLAKAQGEQLLSIADERKKSAEGFTYTLAEGEKLGVVFPVYAWAPPKLVLDFIRDMKLTGYRDNYTFAVCTCGEEAGQSMRLLQKALAKAGAQLHSTFSLVMPSNYLLGMDVDSKEVAQNKLLAAEQTIQHINTAIAQGQQVHEEKQGGAAFLKTAVIGSLFSAFAMNAKPFYTTAACTSCGHCARICPTENITLVGGKPQWSDRCTQCLGCINRCPVRAIEYGKGTAKKGRYHHPSCK